ncbi:MAG: BsaWI family type II restriction enzyme [Anaerolineae bacterium]
MEVSVYTADGKSFVNVSVENISSQQYAQVSDALMQALEREQKAYKAVAEAMLTAIRLCPDANPADLWVHLVYHEYRYRAGRSDQSWKRVSGQAFEDVVLTVYQPRLAEFGLYMRLGKTADAQALGLRERGMGSAKTDLVLEGRVGDITSRFGVLHCKASIAERLSDDAPASQFLIESGYWSAVVTMDAKMFPPPYGDAVVRGELRGVLSDKRGYIERGGLFSACYSFNTRTPSTEGQTLSGARILSLTFSEEQPDLLVQGIVAAWKEFQNRSL